MEPIEIYNLLLREYGPQKWWPVTKDGKIEPEYSNGPQTKKQKIEVAIGAILTQNTSWKNAEKAIINLNKEDLIGIKQLQKINQKRIEEVIRPSGFFRQKSERLRMFADFISNKSFENLNRNELLDLKGIGPETADSILLYASGKTEFVVDAYTKRIFSRLGSINSEDYSKIKEFFQKSLPQDVKVYQEFHALIVEHAKRFCRKDPDCAMCPLNTGCKYYKAPKK